MIIKRLVQQPRPNRTSSPSLFFYLTKRLSVELGDGYGFPSSHSQYMGFFSSFLLCHVYFTHRFGSCGYPFLDSLFRLGVYATLVGWAGMVAYSRYHLGYHTPFQIIWGLVIGTCIGVPLYVVGQVIPQRHPHSLIGQAKRRLLDLKVTRWLQIRDGWAIWGDGGREEEWKRWRREWKKE